MKFLLAFMLLLYGFVAFSQDTDSIEALLKTETDPRKKSQIYLQLVNVIAETDTVKAKQYINMADKLLKKNDLVGKADVMNSWGFYYLPFNLERSIEYYESALELIKDLNTAEARDLRAKLWYNIAATHQRSGRIKESMAVLVNSSIPMAKKASDPMYLANNYLMIGLIFYNENNLEKALQYFSETDKVLSAMPKSQKVNRFKTVSNLYAAEVYLKKENYPMAKKRLDEAKRLLDIHQNIDLQNELHHHLSLYYLFTDQYEKALAEAEAGLRHSEKYKNSYQIVRLTFMKAKILPYLNRYDASIATLKSMIKDENYVAVYGKNLASIYEELSMIEERRGNHAAALEYARKHATVLDSVNAASKNATINEMETRFRTAEKEKELAVKELEVNKKNQYMWTFIITTLVFLGAGVFTYFYFRNKRKLALQREINLQQQLKEKEQTEELKVTKAILDGEERERERVAKDLHDGLGGMLAGVKINLSTWSSNHLEEDQYDSFHRILNQLDSSVSELRRVARNLMPESLLNFGLEIALKDLCEFYVKDDLSIDFQAINISKNLPLNLQINIYRIVQELLGNAVKHANASNIFVQCSQDSEEFFITVEDNGKGIEPADYSKIKSLGLKNLQNRIDFLKGNLQIQSAQNQGTTVNIELKTNAVA